MKRELRYKYENEFIRLRPVGRTQAKKRIGDPNFWNFVNGSFQNCSCHFLEGAKLSFKNFLLILKRSFAPK